MSIFERLEGFVDSAMSSKSFLMQFAGIVVCGIWLMVTFAWVLFLVAGIPMLVWMAIATLVGPVWSALIVFLLICGWIALMGWIDERKKS